MTITPLDWAIVAAYFLFCTGVGLFFTRRGGQSLDADEVLNTVAEATLRVIDYQHFRLYRWDEAAERYELATGENVLLDECVAAPEPARTAMLGL